MSKPRICIVTPGHLASTPRVTKEATALHEAGYETTVVAGDITPFVRPFDEELITRVPWQVVRVRRVGMLLRAGHRLAAAAARTRSGDALSPRLAIMAQSEQSRALRRAASRVQAELYIGHYVAGLSAAAHAARHNEALLGYDAEDFHAGELADTTRQSLPWRLSWTIERSLLPRCRHFTASSPLIGEAYESTYGFKPRVVLNVFPPSMMREESKTEVCPSSAGRLRAYWFSQTIGLDRGLQAFLRAMARTRSHVSLDIRGVDRQGESLMAFAQELGVRDRLTLLPLASPDKMVELAAAYDVGLSLEPGFSENNRRALGNKIFTYLLAGVPVLMSDTPAQRLLAPDLGEAAAVFSLQDSDGMAAQLDRWAFSVDDRQRARATARDRAMTRYNWDLEKQAMLASVASAVGTA